MNDTKNTTVIERLEAAEQHYRSHDERFADGLKHAAEIAASDGWKHIAPAWLTKTADPNRGGLQRTTLGNLGNCNWTT